MRRVTPAAFMWLGRARAGVALVTVALAAPFVSCGGEAPTPQVLAAVSSAQPPLPPHVDLSEVPAPEGLVVSGRIAKPSALLATVHGWTKLPMPQSGQVTAWLTSEAVGPLVDLDQPVDFAVGVAGRGYHLREVVAVAAAVRDPDKVKAALSERYKLVPRDNGVLIIQGLGRPAGDADDDGKPDSTGDVGRACELAPAAGDAPLRLICGGSPAALTNLGPWLARSAPRAPTRSDIQVDGTTTPLQPTIHEGKRLMAMVLGRLLTERAGFAGARDAALALGTDVTDFATDLAGMSLELTAGDAGVQAKLAVQLSGTTSAIARIATAHPERADQVPPAFWQLPADADLAIFERGLDEAEIAKGRDLLLPLVSDALTDEGVKPAEARTLVEAVGKLASAAPVVYASGVDGAALQKALDAQAASAGPRALVQAVLGWRVVELDEPATRLAEALKGLSAYLASPSIAAAYHGRNKGLVSPALHAVPVLKSAGLPAGTLHYVLEIHTPPPGAPAAVAGNPPSPPSKPVTVHLLLVPDGARTWIALGGDESVVTSHLATTLGPTGDKLAARVDVSALRERPAAWGGFFTLRSVTGASWRLGMLAGASRQEADPASQMPHGGAAPILFTSMVVPGATPATLEVRIQIPRNAIEDIESTILRELGGAARSP